MGRHFVRCRLARGVRGAGGRAGGRSGLGSRLEHGGRLRFPAFLTSPPTATKLSRPHHTRPFLSPPGINSLASALLRKADSLD
ncbi:hypothetical protein E2C01_069148 [Portunus trituberculatus]|uniref:Uncharacterized protein n=1 Tax=Portunus trituberculatus TaxID=210409 RepID=A0A5B7HXT6_PORTR|nr:hypothetical protein [Portunus trituberculatus]